jgi:raffinose/stachyose/melibiose transport system substrate-binding protein
MKSKLLIFFVVSLLLVPLVLSAGGEKESAEEEQIVLTFFTQEPGAYPTINTEVQKSFELKHPNVRIDKTVVGYAQFQSTLASLLASGEAPDIIMAEPGGPYISQVQAGAYEDLNPYLESDGKKWEKEFFSSALDLMRVDGSVFAIPVSLNNLQVMLNRGLLEEHGLKEPETLDDFVAMVPKLRKTGVTPITFGFADKWSAVDLFVVFVWQQGAGSLLRKADMGEAKWTDPVFVKAMEAIKKLVDNDVAFEGATAMAWHEDALPNWVQGNSIMVWPGGNFMIQDIPSEMDSDALWFPVMRGGKRMLTGGVALALGVSSTSAHKDLAVEFLMEFTTQDAYSIIFENGVSPGGPLQVDARSAYPLADKVNMQQGDAVDRRIYTPELYDAIAVAVQGIFAGDLSPRDAVRQIQKVSDEVY